MGQKMIQKSDFFIIAAQKYYFFLHKHFFFKKNLHMSKKSSNFAPAKVWGNEKFACICCAIN